MNFLEKRINKHLSIKIKPDNFDSLSYIIYIYTDLNLKGKISVYFTDDLYISFMPTGLKYHDVQLVLNTAKPILKKLIQESI